MIHFILFDSLSGAATLCGVFPEIHSRTGLPIVTTDPFGATCDRCNELLMEQAAGPKEYRISKDQWKGEQPLQPPSREETSWDHGEQEKYIAEPVTTRDVIAICAVMRTPLPK